MTTSLRAGTVLIDIFPSTYKTVGERGLSSEIMDSQVRQTHVWNLALPPSNDMTLDLCINVCYQSLPSEEQEYYSHTGML